MLNANELGRELMVPILRHPSQGTTVAFLAIVAFVVSTFLAASFVAQQTAPSRRNSSLFRTALGVLCWLGFSYLGAQTGFFGSLAGSLKMGAVLLTFNGIAIAVALGPLGHRFANHLPIAALVGFQAFRIPLELVLHSWFAQGTLPIQMTYSGSNYDIATGIVALGLAPVLPRLPPPGNARW